MAQMKEGAQNANKSRADRKYHMGGFPPTLQRIIRVCAKYGAATDAREGLGAYDPDPKEGYRAAPQTAAPLPRLHRQGALS